MKTSFLHVDDLKLMGFKYYGDNIYISRFARFYSPETIEIGSHVRIDDFCVVSGRVIIGSYVHIASHTVLTGGIAGINVGDFANLSQRVNVFANSDDYSGNTLTNPMVPDKYKDLVSKGVFIGRHVIIGCGSVILPGVCIAEGTAIGALSLINCSTDPWSIYAGVPARKMRSRSKQLLMLATEFLDSIH